MNLVAWQFLASIGLKHIDKHNGSTEHELQLASTIHNGSKRAHKARGCALCVVTNTCNKKIVMVITTLDVFEACDMADKCRHIIQTACFELFMASVFIKKNHILQTL